jgi:hypothetical protein
MVRGQVSPAAEQNYSTGLISGRAGTTVNVALVTLAPLGAHSTTNLPSLSLRLFGWSPWSGATSRRNTVVASHWS